MNLNRALLVFLLVLACGQSRAQEALVLKTTAQVTSSGVSLADLLANPDALNTNTLISPAPALGQAVVLTRAQIAELAGRAGLTEAPTNWLGAEKIRVTRKARPLPESELIDLLTATLQREQVRDRGELELRTTRAWQPVLVPDEPLSVRLMELPLAGVTPNFILRFELRSERESVGIWQIPLQAKVWREFWVTRSPQPRGRLLRDADLDKERRDLLLIRDAFLDNPLTEASLELAENLPTGAPLLQRSVRPRPIVLRGKVLEAVVSEGPLMITVKVEALEDGVSGQRIRVRNAKTKREFHAKVQNENTVAVNL